MVDYSILLARLRRWQNYDKIELTSEDLVFLAEHVADLIERAQRAEKELERLRRAGL